MNFKYLLSFILWCAVTLAHSASFYPQRLEDPQAVYVTPSSNGDDTATLQQAVNRVQAATHQGIVLLAPGRYCISNTLYIWPGIRLIGYGPERPVLVLPANTLGFGDAAHEKIMIFFAGARPRDPLPARFTPRSPILMSKLATAIRGRS
jgi:Pectate lyase superfamily protein